MQKILRQDIRNLYEYEQLRKQFVAHIIELKKQRRIAVGPQVSFVFENRDTVLFQIQEMLRAERIVDEGKIQDEMEVYNSLIPPADNLSATMFIEIVELHKIKQEIERFVGLERENRVRLELGGFQIPAIFESGHSTEFRIAAVQYLTFPFNPEQKNVFCQQREPIRLRIHHPNYQHEAVLPPEMMVELSTDLEGPPAPAFGGLR